MPLPDDLLAALSAPVGSHQALLAPAVKSYFGNSLTGSLETPQRTYDLEVAADVDAVFRHLAGGPWGGEVVRQGQRPMVHDRLLSLAFRDAPFDDVRAFTDQNDIPIARILEARSDAPGVLIAWASSTTSARARSSALALAIARLPSIPAGLEEPLALDDIGWAPVAQAALRALGPERAGAVAVRALHSLDEDEREVVRASAFIAVLERFGPFYSPETEATIGALIEGYGASEPYLFWEEVGSRLAMSGEWDAALRFLRARSSATSGWRRAQRSLLARRVREDEGWSLPPELDEVIDPAGAARQTHDVWRLTSELLESIPVERAERLLLAAQWATVYDPLRFVVPGLGEAALQRAARAYVESRDHSEGKYTVAGTDLRPYGPELGPALMEALADVKPKVGFIKSMQRNLAPEVFAPIAHWLETRPEPKKKAARKAPKKAAK